MQIENLNLPMTQNPSVNSGGTPKTTSGFDAVLDFVGDMNDQQVQANGLMSDVILGKSEDTHGALIALEKVSMQMELATKVRDELIQGYNKLINIQI